MLQKIPLSRPSVGRREADRVTDVLRSGRLAMGPQTREFETHFAELCGVRHAVAVSSGTAALHCIVDALELEPRSEVITTPFSFVASSNALLYAGLRPKFVDIDGSTLNIDVELADRVVTARTSAILAVDVFGVPADWVRLSEIATRRGLRLVDDACEALGARVGGKPIGSWGDAAAFGFYPNKQITTGEGGMITTDDDDLAATFRSLRNQGRQDDARMRHVRLGYNYRLSELSAAIGCAQLERFDQLANQRARVAGWYVDALAPLLEHIHLPTAEVDGRRSWFVYVIRLADHFDEEERNQIIARLEAEGIEASPYFPCIHLQPYYAQRFGFQAGEFPVAEHISQRTIALPFFPDMKERQVDRVAERLQSIVISLAHTKVIG